MLKSLNTTVHSYAESMPVFAVRRKSDGYFLSNIGDFTSMKYHDSVDYRTSPNHWENAAIFSHPGEYGRDSYEIVAIARATVITAVPVK
jgi:hypothetical protein